jgi:hypothetical protein
MQRPILTEEKFEAHRKIATQLHSLYFEVNKLATKKPTERITPLISKKINHIIVKVKELILNDEFLDAIETIPVDRDLLRLDETLIVLGELKGIMDKQWGSQVFDLYRMSNGAQRITQVIR